MFGVINLTERKKNFKHLWHMDSAELDSDTHFLFRKTFSMSKNELWAVCLAQVLQQVVHWGNLICNLLLSVSDANNERINIQLFCCQWKTWTNQKISKWTFCLPSMWLFLANQCMAVQNLTKQKTQWDIKSKKSTSIGTVFDEARTQKTEWLLLNEVSCKFLNDLCTGDTAQLECQWTSFSEVCNFFDLAVQHIAITQVAIWHLKWSLHVNHNCSFSFSKLRFVQKMWHFETHGSTVRSWSMQRKFFFEWKRQFHFLHWTTIWSQMSRPKQDRSETELRCMRHTKPDWGTQKFGDRNHMLGYLQKCWHKWSLFEALLPTWNVQFLHIVHWTETLKWRQARQGQRKWDWTVTRLKCSWGCSLVVCEEEKDVGWRRTRKNGQMWKKCKICRGLGFLSCPWASILGSTHSRTSSFFLKTLTWRNNCNTTKSLQPMKATNVLHGSGRCQRNAQGRHFSFLRQSQTTIRIQWLRLTSSVMTVELTVKISNSQCPKLTML